jgi:pyruvate,water dikinase
MLSFPKGGILVVERALPRWAPLLSRAAGLVSETGGMAGHLASVAREYEVPALCGLAGACSLLAGAGEVTLDAGRSAVFAGLQPQLLPACAHKPNLMAGSPVHQRLAALARLMVPLRLLDPEAPEFAPEYCRSLHDITRFCHEKSVELLFSEDAGLPGQMGKQLRAGVKLQYWLVDMGALCRPDPGPGWISNRSPACPCWPSGTAGRPCLGRAGQPPAPRLYERPAGKHHEARAGKLRPQRMGQRNFFIIGSGYMLLQARSGYHIARWKARPGRTDTKFCQHPFKGGAAEGSGGGCARHAGDLLEARLPRRC